jgi:ADP-heptose:LPS heptosyltransferase
MILIAPYSKRMRNGMPSPKDYPYWDRLIKLLNKEPIVQIGIEGEVQLVPDFRKGLPIKDIEWLVTQCSYWISVDSFLPHMASHLGKLGVVLWGPSDPLIFGYPQNLNLLKDRRYLRKRQFEIWETDSFNPEAFLTPRQVIDAIEAWQVTISTKEVAQIG